MGGKWHIPEYPSASVFTLPASRPRCVRQTELSKCRVCHEALKQKELIHPVACYRLWDDYLSTIEEAEHVSTSWEIVSPFLAEHGYTLAARQDAATPSSSQSLRGLNNAEPAPHTHLAKDQFGSLVYIKMVPLYHSTSQEFRVWSRLDGVMLRDDPRNHSIPVREVLIFSPDFSSAGFTPQRSDRRAFVIIEHSDQLARSGTESAATLISLIRNMNDYVAFVRQITEGVAFMHEQGIAHRNLNERNLLAQWTGVGHQWLIADYELSIVRNLPGAWTVRPSAMPAMPAAGKRQPPDVPSRPNRGHDPFAADVWNLGFVIESLTRAVCLSDDPQWVFPEDLRLLLNEMTALDPRSRPSSAAVQQRITSIFRPPDKSVLSQCLSYLQGASGTATTASGPYLLAGAAAGLLATQRYFRYR